MPIHSHRVGAFAALVVPFAAFSALARVAASTLAVSAAAPQGYELTVPPPGVLVAACAGAVIARRRRRSTNDVQHSDDLRRT